MDDVLPLTRARRRALLSALAGHGAAWGPGPGEPGTRAGTWRGLQADGLVDAATPVPGPAVPSITAAGLRALGLPEAVGSAEEALRVAVARLIPWRRPALRFGARKEAVFGDHPDDGAPVAWSAHPCAIATASTGGERAWERAGNDADLGWDAVTQWTERVGFPLDVVDRGDVRVVLYDPDDRCATVAWADGQWRDAPWRR